MPKGWDGIISRYVNRKFSRPVAGFLAKKTRITPNHVTILSFLLGVFSGVAFSFHQSIIGGVLAQTASIMDGVDGDLAVLTRNESRFGSYLDSVLDRYGDAVIVLGLMFNVLTFKGDFIKVLLVSFTALFGSLMVSYSRSKAESLNVFFKTGISGYAANRDVRLFVIMIGGILNQAYITLVTLAAITNFVVFKRLFDVGKKGG